MTRLRRSDPSSAGYRRTSRGRGFSYVDGSGIALSAVERARIQALAIPLAWREVWICPYPNGHIQAIGVDEAGRRQYIYHPAWHERMAREKYDRMLALTPALPAARRWITRALRGEGLGRERVLAAALRLLDTAGLRIGSERYAQEHGSAGLSTLRTAHARVAADGRVVLRFPGKSGRRWRSTLTDPDLAALLAVLARRGPRARLLAWRDEEDAWHPLSAEEINAVVRRQLGDDFTAKDFRTLHGTVAAAESLARSGPGASARSRRYAIAEATRAAAETLGNTPAIARASYIDPRLFDAYAEGRTVVLGTGASVEAQLPSLLAE